jgi:RNA polymerase sigma-70 factor, ECF subfamily
LTDWAAIAREHGGMAFETAWRILGNASDTEDAVQEAFMDALRIHRQPTVIGNWGALLRHLASRRALDLLRKRRPVLPIVADLPAPQRNSADASSDMGELVCLVRQALAQLPSREAEVFSLRCFGDLSNPEIAEQLGIRVGAVAVALHKARLHLQTILKTTEV